MEMLNPITMPLYGHNLIEASAGTGKTYTITALYLRYLLGLVEHQESACLSVEQILVVTFTEAATQEIKDRVRARIIDARDVLLGAECADPLIPTLLAQVKDKQAAFKLLDAAAKSMDEAAIFTIHGFCQRMLKQHAFESKLSFNLEFILDETELLKMAVEDHWRKFLYTLDKDQTALVLEHFAHPQSLMKKLIPLLSKSGAKLTPQVKLDDVLAARAQYQTRAAEFKQALRESEFITCLNESALAKNKAPGRAANINALGDYVASDAWYFEFGTSKHSFNLWGSAQLGDAKNYKKNAQLITHHMISQFDEMAKLHHQVKNLLPIALLQDALKQVKALLVQHKQIQSTISPDDLLSNLYEALQGDAGEVLANKIVQQFPVALIDEFQDTDPIQYGIFSTVYAGDANSALTMIGDPKQAIYGFRGADIFTYIAAKQAVDETRHFTLAKNYRSAKSVVDSVNAIFTQHERSFIFNEDIPFYAVDAQGKSEQQSFSNDTEQVLNFCVFDSGDGVTSKAQAHQALAQAFSAKIATLLSQAQLGQVSIGGEAIKAADICVLVRDRNEASVMKQALHACGVSAVYLARDSVYGQPVASALNQLLHVLHGAYDEAALRGVLVSPLFALNYEQVYSLSQNEQQWQSYLDFFAELKRVWYQSGAMAMLEKLMVHNQLASVWRANGYEVERWLTDYRHLAELLQHKQIELEGTQRVLRWLSIQCSEATLDGAQLRLESDANLVKIVTMHASKGLEYPIVYMPFALGYRDPSEIIYHQDKHLIIDLDADDHGVQAASKERLAEDIRLLYVALTRAVHYCELGLFNIALGRSKKLGIGQTALGFALFGDTEFKEAQQWHQALEQLCLQHSGMSMEIFETPPTAYFGEPQAQVPVALGVKDQNAAIEINWRTTSFSQLSYHAHHDDRPAGALDEHHELDLPRMAQTPTKTPYSFVKGAKAGSCLHEIYEQIDFTSPHTPVAGDKLPVGEVVEACLDKYQIDEQWRDCVTEWVVQSLACPLNAVGDLSLSRLAPEHCLVEMEFHLPLSALRASQLNKVLTDITGQPSFLQFDQVQGMLKGFIDLIFRWQGKYYVLDYKSNYLGDELSDYSDDNLMSAMSSHQYHLQYLIYSVALHRLLKYRLADYTVGTHLGGVYYLFLRALPQGGGVFFKALTEQELLTLDALFDPEAS
ncbi:exodeoxyribonuclease V subunit beta [Pseudoalteromonas luteoviolacea]|uniref:exodeoxyribonuclease V subunit beta n=1 Tax=Pseudoalteromonas luteoviolacea TaxID=43657 RepID=UPI001EEE69F6|nr:exodeoxyribonuclease V subunit beta [Pseudoalteromonas luteoviolacea]MCF6442752.1 exodeoxyribonuclease V subunit beta [Pseudoalteromonas luteoviolacea]